MDKLYCSLKSIPELSQLSATDRLRAWFACVHKTFFYWQTWVACLAAMAPYFGYYFFLIWFVQHAHLIDPNRSVFVDLFVPLLIAFVLSMAGTVILTLIQVEIIRPYLRQYLANRNAA